MSRFDMHTIRTGGASAALVAVLGLAFACSESPTEVALDDLTPQFDHKGKPHGKPGGQTNDCGFTPLEITFVAPGPALLNDDGGEDGEYIEETDGGVHLNGATGRLMLWTSQYGAPTRHVKVFTELLDYETTDRIYTNGHKTAVGDDLGCGFLQMENGSTGSAVLEAELDSEGIVRWGKDCEGNFGDPLPGNRVVTTRSNDGNSWTITGTQGVICKYGPKVKGKRPLNIGSAGAFSMTLKKS